MATLLTVVILFLNQRGELSVWHEVKLENQFRAVDEVFSFAEYLDLEAALFEEVKQKVYAVGTKEGSEGIARYLPGSPANPSSYGTD